MLGKLVSLVGTWTLTGKMLPSIDRSISLSMRLPIFVLPKTPSANSTHFGVDSMYLLLAIWTWSLRD